MNTYNVLVKVNGYTPDTVLYNLKATDRDDAAFRAHRSCRKDYDQWGSVVKITELPSSRVFTTFAANKTPRQAADEFAETYFAQPRKVDKFNFDKFTLVDGASYYSIELDPPADPQAPAMYSIIRH